MKTNRIIIILALTTLSFISCSTVRKPINNNYIKKSLDFDIRKELNNSVIEGFFDNDSSKIPKDCNLFLK